MKLQLLELLQRPVNDMLHKTPVLKCTPDTSVKEAVKMLQDSRVGSIIVSQDLRIVGIFTERDFLMKIAFHKGDWTKEKISTFMTANPVCIQRHERIGKLLLRMRRGKFRHLVVVDSYGNLENIISMRDIVDYLIDAIRTGLVCLFDEEQEKEAPPPTS